MFKVALTALVAMPLTFASADAFDNFGPDNAAAAFGQYGLQGLGVAGRRGPTMAFVYLARPRKRPPIRLRIDPFAGRDMRRLQTETP